MFFKLDENQVNEIRASLYDVVEKIIEGLIGADTNTTGSFRGCNHSDLGQIKPAVICGTKELAIHLGCGKTKAFEIIKSEVLTKTKPAIQYRVGNKWFFNATELDECLSNDPNFLNSYRNK